MIYPASIPSPPHNGFYLGPLFVHAYGLAYVFAVAAGRVPAVIPTLSTTSQSGRSPPG